jgi:GT2 family glycosyltransferase
MTATASTSVAADAPERAPSVLVVLVAGDAVGWVRDSLSALAAQTYPRVAVLAVDDGSTDGTHRVLRQALGEERVVRHDERLGLAASVAEVAALPVAAAADFLLLLHDDAAPDDDAVARLVDATMIPGVERVGIVGAKVVDWGRPRMLRDVGKSADRFGHPYSPLQPDELDQGQFDRVLEVLTVDSCTMLVARDVWQGLGLFDERLGEDADLDLCWRARVAGWRVVMTPLARVRHRAVDEQETRTNDGRSRRYEEDRAALATILKNYGFWSLLRVLPLAVVLTTVRLAFLTLARRFEEGYELLRAWGWNVAHLGGTLARRRQVQRARRVRDRNLRRFTESAGLRVPRWFQTAERILEEQREIDEADEETPVARRLRRRTASLVTEHPVVVASAVAIAVGGVVVRDLLGPERLVGGALPTFPAQPSGFFAELASAYRTTGLGGSLAASPALAAMGGLSYLTFASTALAQKLMLAGGPALGAVLMYRATVRRTRGPGPSVLAAAAYALSAVMLWAFSEGRLDVLVGLAVLPVVVERLEVAFSASEPRDGRWRLAAGLAVTLAVGVAFLPGIALAFAVAVLVQAIGGRSRGRGIGVSGLALIGAAVLLFPFVPTLVVGDGIAFGSPIGTSDISSVLRLAPGGGPGTWEVSLFLPVAAALGFALVRGALRAPALRAAALAIAGVALAWLSAAGWLPSALSNAPAYTALAAVAEALLVGFGLSSALRGLGRESFGFLQIGAALLGVVLAVGLLLQTLAVAVDEPAFGGPERIPAAWAVVDSASEGAFRVLWVRADDGRPFPPPAGDPSGLAEAGDATLRFGLTDRRGSRAIDIGRPLAGPGAVRLHDVLGDVLAGSTVHGGALLAQFGIRYVIGSEGAVPPAALERLEAQVDLDTVPASGLVVLRNAVDIPLAAVLQVDPSSRHIISSSDDADHERLVTLPASPLDQVHGGWDGIGGPGGLVFVSTEFDEAWQLEGSASDPARAIGWATAFPSPTGEVHVRYGAQLPRTIQMWLLAAVWAVALWVTRRPVRP